MPFFSEERIGGERGVKKKRNDQHENDRQIHAQAHREGSQKFHGCVRHIRPIDDQQRDPQQREHNQSMTAEQQRDEHSGTDGTHKTPI